jgi:peptidoglycan/xylan/chitin deacetylase (PgdA/CDA1 family)
MSSNNNFIKFPLHREKVVCLTLDLEQDYGELLDSPSYEGIERVDEFIQFFQRLNLPLTCFVQGSLFDTHPKSVEALRSLDVDLELHSYTHPNPSTMNFEYEVKAGKDAYFRYMGKFPLGYRSPLASFDVRTDFKILDSNGFKFDSSVCPSFRPGVFSNLLKPTEPYYVKNTKIVEFPVGILSKIIRIPAGLSYSQLLSKKLFYLLKLPLAPSTLVFNFHLADILSLRSWRKLDFKNYPIYYRKIFNKIYSEKPNGKNNLENFISICYDNQYEFLKLTQLLGNTVVQEAIDNTVVQEFN